MACGVWGGLLARAARRWLPVRWNAGVPVGCGIGISLRKSRLQGEMTMRWDDESRLVTALRGAALLMGVVAIALPVSELRDSTRSLTDA